LYYAKKKKLKEEITEITMMIYVFGISTTKSMTVCTGDVLEKPNHPDPILCVGENQSNVTKP
jgi:hypothetical protein